MSYEDSFKRFVEKAHRVAKKFLEDAEKNQPILVVSHNDADGISSAAIFSIAMKEWGIKHIVKFVQVIKEETINEVSDQNYKTIVFLDLGSGVLDLISKYLQGKNVYILDHHILDEMKIVPQNTTILNPKEFGLGEKFASASSVCWLFAKILGIKNPLIYVNAIIGATGDIQYIGNSSNFEGLNKIILEEAELNNILEIKRDISVPGKETKPLVDFLKSLGSFDKENMEEKITNLGIELKRGGQLKVFNDLTQKEKKIFLEFIEKELEIKLDNFIENEVYIKQNIFPIKNIKELVAIINSTGKLESPWIGYSILLGMKGYLIKALEILREYREEIMKILQVLKNRDLSFGIDILEGENFVIINFKDKLKATLVGTVMSMVMFSKIFDKEVFVGLSYDEDKYIKVSLRTKSEDVNVREVLKEVMKLVGRGEFGGHKNAAGAVIFREDEDKFIEEFKNYFELLSLEESI